jgi:hypothetical protein
VTVNASPPVWPSLSTGTPAAPAAAITASGAFVASR